MLSNERIAHYEVTEIDVGESTVEEVCAVEVGVAEGTADECKVGDGNGFLG